MIHYKVFIQWFKVLEDDHGVDLGKPFELTEENADVFAATEATEAECLAVIYRNLFESNWTAIDSTSRHEVTTA